jgi:hypothetical protein
VAALRPVELELGLILPCPCGSLKKLQIRRLGWADEHFEHVANVALMGASHVVHVVIT